MVTCLLSTYCMPHISQGMKNTAVSSTYPPPLGVYEINLWAGGEKRTQINKIKFKGLSDNKC